MDTAVTELLGDETLAAWLTPGLLPQEHAQPTLVFSAVPPVAPPVQLLQPATLLPPAEIGTQLQGRGGLGL